jgi:capsular polysaccharide biosynthesis protein
MELRELSHRLLQLHAKLIIALIVVGVLGGLALHVDDEPQYQAKARLVLGAEDPRDLATAAALADTARGIVTGPQLVGKAIKQVGVPRDAETVAAAINVNQIGSSGVLSLTIEDRDPQVAVKLANALASAAVSTRIDLLENGLAASIRDLDQQAASVGGQIQKLNTRIEALAAAPAQNRATAQLGQLEARRTSLEAEATQIAVQRNALVAQQGQRPETTVTDKAVSAAPVQGRRLLDALLGGMLGLVLGIAVAALREAFWPSLVGGPAIARAVDAPLLGEMSGTPDSWTRAALPDSGTYVELAADSANVGEVRFGVLDPNGRGAARVRMLEGPLHRMRFHQTSDAPQPGPVTGTPAKGRPVPTSDADASDVPTRTGLVVAIPRVLKVADIDALTNFIWISGWCLLGVIVYRSSHGRKSSAGPGPERRSSHVGARSEHVEVDV